MITSILFLVVVLTAINIAVMRALDTDLAIRNLQHLNTVEPYVHPFTKVYKRLEEFNWDPIAIEEAVREHWNTTKSFVRHKIDNHGENVTILSTSCFHNAPWILVALLELPALPTKQYTLYRRPLNTNLIIYDNTKNPRSILPKPPVENMRNFIHSRPSSESILFQVDLWQLNDITSSFYSDHHLMIHAYEGQICLYHAWQWQFNLIDWMTNEGSFDSRYPMDEDIFFGHFERMLAPAETKEEIRARDVAVWSIFGKTKTQKWVKGKEEGQLRIDDVVVRELYDTWLPVQIMHWPNSIEPLTSTFRPVNVIRG